MSYANTDQRRTVRLRSAFLRNSEKHARLKVVTVPPEKGLSRKDGNSASPKGKITVKTNRVGGLTGLNPASHFDSEAAKAARLKRRIYNKRVPALACNSCAYSSSCPQFKAGFECAFKDIISSHTLDNIEDLSVAMQSLVEAGMERYHLAAIMERLSGAPPGLELSEQQALLFGQAKQLLELRAGTTEVSFEAEDGIVSRLFGDIGSLIDDTTNDLGRLENDPLLPLQAPQEDPSNVAGDEVAHDYAAMTSKDEQSSGKPRKKSATPAKVVTAQLIL